MNSRAWMIGLLVIMAVICSSSLSFVNIKTAPIIQKNEEIKYMSTVLDVFGITFDRDNSDEIYDIFKKRIEEREEQGLTLFSETTSSATAVSFSGNGFQGAISLVVALDGETITGFKVVSQVETPGLGARITEEEFQRSFIGKRVSEGISMSRSGNAGPGEFDAITGATETSRALERILTRGLGRYFQTQ
ncbi:MAG: RnfABCDGE type electron transport complex subunit G [Candidatus Latescibacteria bacterium]|jgi:RnfABCDGE-type electron transport complex G subunit|nr:RnfABCDGE type electron transport complex subunit G [Candidatus Latescibacterota bacterium]